MPFPLLNKAHFVNFNVFFSVNGVQNILKRANFPFELYVSDN